MHKLIPLALFGEERLSDTQVTSPQAPNQASGAVPQFSHLHNSLPSPAKVRRDEEEVYEQLSLDPDDKDRLFLQISYRFKRTKELDAQAGLYIPDDEFPSDVFWGRLEKHFRD